MKNETLSARQLRVAVITGGLSTGAAAAGRADWRWLLPAAAMGTLAGWLLLRRLEGKTLHPVVNTLYCAWSVVLMADVLRRTAQRIQGAAGGRGNAAWLLALLALPLIWMGWGKAAAFFRAVEIFWLATVVTVAAILLLGIPRVDWRWAVEPVGSWQESLGAGALTMSTGLFVLPHLYKVKPEVNEGIWRGPVWLGMLGVLSAVLGLVAQGLLSPGVAAKLDGPFFAAAGLLGDSARLEGLVSALWLLPDLTLAGLLSRAWGERRGPAVASAAALGLAFTGLSLPVQGLALGGVALVVLSAVAPLRGNK